MSLASQSVADQTVKIIENSTRQAENQEQVKSALSNIDSSVQALAAISVEGSATVREVRTLDATLNDLVDEMMSF